MLRPEAEEFLKNNAPSIEESLKNNPNYVKELLEIFCLLRLECKRKDMQDGLGR